jgi:hypothetical protein
MRGGHSPLGDETMHSRKTFLARLLGSLVVLCAGCDSEHSDDGTNATSIVDDDDDDDDAEPTADDGEPQPTEPPDDVKTPGGAAEPYCGDGDIDADEDCDDGPDNGRDRECTHNCRLNDCELDEVGLCLAATALLALD